MKCIKSLGEHNSLLIDIKRVLLNIECILCNRFFFLKELFLFLVCTCSGKKKRYAYIR